MGFFDVLGKAVGKLSKALAEQLWPVYNQLVEQQRPDTLVSYVENETNIIRKAVYLLALMRHDRYKAKKLYDENRRLYNNAFNQLKEYKRFVGVIDDFMRKASY